MDICDYEEQVLREMLEQQRRQKDLYTYEGPVMSFGNCICRHFTLTTYAVSEAKARSNIMYQFKKQNNMALGTKIELPGTIFIG